MKLITKILEYASVLFAIIFYMAFYHITYQYILIEGKTYYWVNASLMLVGAIGMSYSYYKLLNIESYDW